jgi:hypothetical protein
VDDKELDAIIGEEQQLERVADSGPIKAFMRAAASMLGSST